MDLQTWASLAEIASLAAILSAGGFAVYQLRADRLARQDAAAFAVVQKFMDSQAFMEAARHLLQLPLDWSDQPISKETQHHMDRAHMTLETIGFAVHRGAIRLDDVESLMGGVSRQLWKALAPMARKERATSPRWYEWTEWLVLQLEAARPGGGARPMAPQVQ